MKTLPVMGAARSDFNYFKKNYRLTEADLSYIDVQHNLSNNPSKELFNTRPGLRDRSDKKHRKFL